MERLRGNQTEFEISQRVESDVLNSIGDGKRILRRGRKYEAEENEGTVSKTMLKGYVLARNFVIRKF
jgi:hypothetical protein